MEKVQISIPYCGEPSNHSRLIKIMLNESSNCFGLRVTCKGFPWCLSHIQPRAPYDFYHPYDLLPVRPSEAPAGLLRRCCPRGHIRLHAPYGLTRLYTYGFIEWFAGLHVDPLRCPCGRRTGSVRKYLKFIIHCGTCTGPVRDPQGCRTDTLRNLHNRNL